MKKVFRIHHRAHGEEGMALLFALGFLALLLILGLGFVTTSLLSQKIAANNSSRAQSRMFARSAAARAMLNIMLYNDQAIQNGVTIENYDSIRSYDKVDYNDNGNVVTASAEGSLNDQLRPSAAVDAKGNPVTPSKFKYQIGAEDYSGDNSDAKWMFFYDSPEGTEGRRIIGRAAFQVLPRQAGRFSLYAIAGGSKQGGDYNQYPHSFRWGRDIAELNLQHTKTLENWYASVNEDNIPFKYDTLYTSYSTFFSADTDKKKKWIEYWFAEGKNSILKDAFPKLDPSDSKGKKVIYFNRFNISDYYYKQADRDASGNDNWYDRFRKTGSRTDGWAGTVDELKNTENALDRLAGKAVAYKETHTEDSEVDPCGLPFLKCIGNDKWSFESLKDLRKQIAANFNDYCDKDNIPTSDVKAADWDVLAETDKFPTYTGNERTLYINEVALKLGNITTEFTCGNKNSQHPTGTKVEIKSITPALIAELVNMYDPDYGETKDKELLDPANYEFQTALKKLSFNVALKVKFKFSYQYHLETNNGPGPTQTSPELTAEVDYADAIARISFAPTSPAVKTITFGALNGGYSVGSAALDAISNAGGSTPITQPDSQIFVEAIYNAMNEDFSLKDDAEFERYVSIEVSSIGIRIEGDGETKDAAINFAPFLLKAKSTVADDVKGKGVDFVRMDRVGDMKIHFPADEMKTSEVTPAPTPGGATHTFSDFACFIGGIEARDPRQNLNPRYSATDTNVAKISDWNLTPKFVLGPAVSGVDTIPSMAISNNAVADTDTVGKKNRHVNPAAPKYAPSADPDTAHTSIAAADCDKETAEDPAWLGSGQADSDHTVAQHVSTAYIRNAPMVSPWEIGLIHRGREWQTLNIKRAGGFGSTDGETIRISDIESDYGAWDEDVGTEYKNGDGAILDFIKVGTGCRCMGKVPLTLLREAVVKPGSSDWNGIDEAYNRDIVRMLFDGIRFGQTMKQFYAETKFDGASAQGGTEFVAANGNTDAEAVIDDFITAVKTLYEPNDENGNRKFRLRSQFLNSKYGDQDNSFSFGLADTKCDAAREEIIGKTVNLLTANEITPPNVFRVLVVAQSIKDVGGIPANSSDLSNASEGVPITKIHTNSTGSSSRETLHCLLGRFDFISDSDNWEYNTYFDEITGEVKALVTIERVPQTDDIGEKNKDYGRMVVTGIEFIE